MALALKGKFPGISLRLQLHLLIVLVALFTFASSLYLSVQSTQQYLNTQMKSHAQDAATSLGLSISAYMDDPDLVIAQTMVSAIFDSGYYEELTFTNTAGEVKIHRKNPVEYDEVPPWFVEMFPLTPPMESSEVNSGWVVAGKLAIKSNPGIAYKTLWHQAKQSFFSIAAITLFSILVIQLIAFAVLRPLRQIESQALEVGKKNFMLLDKLPFTTDLRSVVKAMNAMVGNIQRSFTSLSKQADELKVKVFTDHLTGLGNRRLLEQHFAAAQKQMQNHETSLHIGMLSLHSLAEVNHLHGYEAADQYILRAVNEFKDLMDKGAEIELFRISGSDIVFLSQEHSSVLERLLNMLSGRLKLMDSDFYTEGFGAVVMMEVDAKDPLSHCLSTLDNANIQRKQQPDLPVVVSNESLVKPEGRMAWNHLIQELVAKADFELWAQPVVNANNSIAYIETFVRFIYRHSPLSTAETYAMAEQQGLALQLDQQVISFILAQVKDKPDHMYAINLSLGAIGSKAFAQWLDKELKQLPAKVKLVFELSEYSVLKAPEETKALFELIKRNKCKICIERFGASMTTFKYLQGLNVDYVKIDGAYSTAIEDQENRFFIKTLCQICHGLGIKVLAPHIECEQMMDSCFAAGVDAVQGNWLLAPQKAGVQVKKSTLTPNLINLDLAHSPKF
ncbi:EAL domain-containing protein [Rheinheimera sp.]|uniref:bifunctional diguanylate cyclase/phosphodiesterase n=1 Tax=Rheinheimera sp. TaxID=1869214 RepID=UPI00307ED773